MIDSHVHCFPPQLADRALHGTLAHRAFEVDGTLARQIAFAKQEGLRRFLLLNFASRPENMAHVNKFAVRATARTGWSSASARSIPSPPTPCRSWTGFMSEAFGASSFNPFGNRSPWTIPAVGLSSPASGSWA